ncbi:glycosyltransferase involved in cell wall biosynthesis [Leifsonia sp. EB41]|uniref:glycosyltransferase family 2 protein n=1 Tax=Leifsonia sp. EB41 TaxID=3156260 RepID=UPI0035168F93
MPPSFSHHAPRLSVVVPIHNSAFVLARTIERWTAHLTEGHTEVILVENGSTDVTWELAQELARDTPHVKFVLLQSERGMGNALRAGIAASHGHRVLLTADDLPFDFGDLEEESKLDPVPSVVIGSKAHPRSEISRAVHRRLLTHVYKQLRSAILDSEVGDSQGTIIADGGWLRSVAPSVSEPGFLFTTQLIYIAELLGIDVVEVPVTLSADHAPKKSTVRLGDVWEMGAGLFRLRRQRRQILQRVQQEAV